MEAQRKVTCFVTRGSGPAAELLVFWHNAGGVQVPAGTVEDRESFDEAAVREVFEETALPGLQLQARLGRKAYEMDGRAFLRRDVRPRLRPEPGAPAISWQVPRARVLVLDRRAGFARIVYAEQDLDSDSGIVFARFEGWVPEEDVCDRQERHFYHFLAGEDTPDTWRTMEGVHEFHLYWVPLIPKPELLIGLQQEWLDDFYPALLAGVEAT